MAKKRKKPVQTTHEDRQTSHEDRHTTPRVVFHLPEALLAVVDAQAEANDRTRTGEILRALKGYYGAQGFWPPKQHTDEN